MDTPITPPTLANTNRDLATQAKAAAKELARTLGALEHACGQLNLHQSPAAENWYQRSLANVIKANRKYRELVDQLL